MHKNDYPIIASPGIHLGELASDESFSVTRCQNIANYSAFWQLDELTGRRCSRFLWRLCDACFGGAVENDFPPGGLKSIAFSERWENDFPRPTNI